MSVIWLKRIANDKATSETLTWLALWPRCCFQASLTCNTVKGAAALRMAWGCREQRNHNIGYNEPEEEICNRTIVILTSLEGVIAPSSVFGTMLLSGLMPQQVCK